MEQGSILISNKNVAVIGGGPAGCICAKILSDAGINTTLFDKGDLLRTLLPTGGGRCNLANAIFDFKELTQNYPRGNKFLYSVFSQFGTKETLEFFESVNVKTYTQEDNRIFPISNSSADVRKKILNSLKCKFIKENVQNIIPLSSGFEIITSKSRYYFDKVVIAIGGHADYNIFENLNINIIPPTQSLVGLITKENFSSISGVSIKDIKSVIDKNELCGDIIFTHKGISGPLIYSISSIYARKKFPYIIKLKLTPDFDLQNALNSNPHKEIKNLISNFIPKSLSEYILNDLNIDIHTPCCKINGQMRNLIYKNLISFEINVSGKVPDGEVVTCGGVDLKEINPQTLELKKYKGIYFCGEILDIDGFCGGFNLQNCWSTGYVAANAILKEIIC